MTEKTLVKNVKTLEDRIAEAIRGPAIAFLTKVAAPWTKGTQQPVVRHRAPDGQTVDQSPTPDAPVMTLGGGGFELSTCFDANDPVLSIPLERDHTNYLTSGKLSDPASPRRHDRGLAVALPFSVRKTTAAAAGELFLGHTKAGPSSILEISLRFKRLEAKLEIRADGGIKIGINATRGAARLNDTVSRSALMGTWMNQVTVGLNKLDPGSVTPYVGSTIGSISSASSIVEVE